MFDLRLYLVTDSRLSLGRSNREVVESALKGGVTCVQFRDKYLDDDRFLEEARDLQTLLAKFHVPLIINDRVDIARELSTDGLHLGQTDMPIAEARRHVGRKAVIGISAECVDDAVKAEEQGADYIGISPVFATSTKIDTAPPLGLEGVLEIRKRVKIPLVAIGGINIDNAENVIKAGADGIAVVSAIVSQQSPEAAGRMLLERVMRA